MTFSKLELFHNLVNLAAVDGKFAEEEITFLAVRAERWGISHDEFETAIAGLMSGQLEISLPDTQAKREELLKELIRLMASDGDLAEMEKQLCATASAKMGFSTGEFRKLLDQVMRAKRS